MLEFIKTFLKSYLLPILKQAVAQVVIQQIEDSIYPPRRQGYIRNAPRQYGRRPFHAVSDED